MLSLFDWTPSASASVLVPAGSVTKVSASESLENRESGIEVSDS